MITKTFISSTNIDKHGDKMSKEALEKLAFDINNGPKLRVMVAHRKDFPPIGIAREAVLFKEEDGEYYLYGTQEIFEHYEIIKINGLDLLLSHSENSPSHFSDIKNENVKSIEVHFDKNCFESYTHVNLFLKDISQNKNINFKAFGFLRKAEFNIPEYIINFTTDSIITVTIFKYLLKPTVKEVFTKLSQTISEGAKDLIDFINKVIRNGLKYAVSQKAVNYIFEFNNEILQVELFAKIEKGQEEFLLKSLFSVTKLNKIAKDISEYYNKIPEMTMIQFVLNENGKWQFNYLLTSNGSVIGTKQIIKKRNKKLQSFSDIDIDAIIFKALNQKNDSDNSQHNL